MYADELKTVFHRDGFTLTGFVGPNPDSKEDKLYTLSDLHKLSTVFDDGQLHAGKTTICTAQWERIGNKTEDSSAYYTKADDGTVKIESVDQDELKKQLETDSTAQIDVSGLEAEKVTLPVSAVNDVLDLEAKALSIKMADAAITLDKTAMQSVVETADGNDIQLYVSTGDALSSDQTEIIGDIEQGMVLDVSLTANGTEIHSFDGEVTVSVSFTWTQQGVLQAWYLADDGKTKEPVEVAYRDGNAVLTLKHFSTYAIVVKANDPDRSADGGERFGLHRRAQIVDRAVQRDVVLAVVDARERARGGVGHRVEKATVHAAPDVGIFRRDVGGQHAFFLVDRNDADAVVTDKAAVLARKHFLIIFDHDALASFRRGISD